MSETPETPPQGNRPGHLLKRAREAKNLSVAAIATQMNLDLRIVEALEAGDQSKLPAPIFVRGYLRGYARLVDVAESEVLSAYQAQSPQEPVPRAVGMASAPLRPALRRSTIPWGGLLVLLLVIGLAVAGFTFGPQLLSRLTASAPMVDGAAPDTETTPGLALPLPETATSPETQPTAEAPDETANANGDLPLPLPPPAPEAAREPAPQPVTEPEPALPPEHDFGTGENTATDALPETASGTPSEAVPGTAPEATPNVMGTQSAASAPVPGEARLSFRFIAQSWAEVRAADGSKLLFGLFGKGETRAVSGRAPVSVLLGNAAGVELHVDGKPFDIAARSRNNIARFQIQAAVDAR